MRLLHISDIHFGIENYSKIDPATGLPTRLLDFTAAFDRAIEYALQNGVDAVLFTGDAYKTRDPSPTVQREFAKRISRLSRNNIPVFLLTGNHDLPNSANRAHSIEIFETLPQQGIVVSRKIELVTLKTRSGPLQIVSLPWLTRTALLDKDEFRGRTMNELDLLLLERMGQVLDDKIRLLDPNIPAVLAVHATLDGSVWSSERSIMLGQDLVVPKSLLYPDRFDYIAFGHIHKHQDFIAGDTPIVYAGSIERIDFGEEKEDKGFVVIEIDDPGGGRLTRRTQWKFQADYRTRPFKTLEVNLMDGDELINPTELALQGLRREHARLGERGLREAIVRLKLKLKPEQRAMLREEELRQVLEKEFGVYYIAGISREVEETRRTRLAGINVEELTPLQLLEKYLQDKKVSPQRIELLLKYANNLVQGATPAVIEEASKIPF